MKRILGITFAVFGMAAMAFGADNTLGSWKYDVAKSKPAPGVSPITILTVTRGPVESLYGGAKTSAKGERADGSKLEFEYTVKYDGKDVAVTGSGLPFDTLAVKPLDDNTLTEMRSKKGGKYKETVQIAVSKDGKTMTLKSKGTDADGKSFTSVIVFDKQ